MFKILTDSTTAYNLGITFEQAVLLAIVRLREDALRPRDSQRSSGAFEAFDIAAGAIDATLERLEGEGLIRSRLGLGTPIRGGRARRFYRLEAAGVEALNAARAAVITSGMAFDGR